MGETNSFGGSERSHWEQIQALKVRDGSKRMELGFGRPEIGMGVKGRNEGRGKDVVEQIGIGEQKWLGWESEFWGRICRQVQVRENQIWGISRIWRIKTCLQGRDGV